jgi:hypothetical protein
VPGEAGLLVAVLLVCWFLYRARAGR